MEEKKYYLVKSKWERGEWYFAWMTDLEAENVRRDKRLMVERRKPPVETEMSSVDGEVKDN